VRDGSGRRAQTAWQFLRDHRLCVITQDQVNLVFLWVEIIQEALCVEQAAGAGDGNEYFQQSRGPGSETGKIWRVPVYSASVLCPKQLESGLCFRTMVGMLNPGKAFGCVLAAGLLAGCAATPHGNSGHALDWQSEEFASAPPPRSAPVVPPPAQPTTRKPAPTNHFSETWMPLSRWCKANRITGPTCVTMAPLPTYDLQTTNGVFRLHAGSQLAQWNGLELRLGFAPQMIDNQPFVHALDLQKSIQPLVIGNNSALFKPVLLNPTELSVAPIIVIDPGHGGDNSGTVSVLGDHFEKDFTLDWAMRLERLLSTKGWHAFLTRSNDTDIALSNRVMVAESHKADLFLSLHFNSAAPDEHQSGLELIVLPPPECRRRSRVGLPMIQL
jgi:N-acetylmuramoyl-L-alanine amidase